MDWNDFRFSELEHRDCGGRVRVYDDRYWRCDKCENKYPTNSLWDMTYDQLKQRFSRRRPPPSGTVVLEEHEEDKKRFFRTRYL